MTMYHLSGSTIGETLKSAVWKECTPLVSTQIKAYITLGVLET